ncbi:MAG: stage III sporulation protein AE [Ruminococcaceae bacterium]|nr:stage III sporulation protein AE [Oscillospiraceae bacterium]
MKKTAIIALILMFFTTFLHSPALGTLEVVEDAVPDSAREILGEADAEETDSAIDSVFDYIKEESGEIFTESLKRGAAVLLIPIICALAGTLYNDKMPDVITIVGIAAAGAVCLDGTNSFIGMGRELIEELDSFYKVLLPTLTATAAASGAVTSAAAKYAAAALFIEVLISVGKSVILPLIYAYIAVSIGGAAFGGGLDSASKFIKWLTVTAMTILVMAFTIYLTMTGVVSGTADAAATKLTKSALSTALPVVGGIISDAASAVVSGTSMLKSTTGVFGMIVVLAVCAVPFMRLGINYLIFKGAAAIAEPFGEGKISKVISSAGTALGMMLGLCGSIAVMLYISIISLMKVVT